MMNKICLSVISDYRPVIRVLLTILFASFVAASAQAGEEQGPCVRMIESWYGVDPTPLDKDLHPEFIKQGVYRDRDGATQTPTMDKAEFIAAVGDDRKKMPPEDWDITAETVELTGPIATVKVTSAHLVDVCQLGNIDGEWQVINVIWTLRKT